MQIDINLTWFFCFLIVCLSLFLIHSGFGTRLFVKKDIHIADKFFDKFPLVDKDLLKKDAKSIGLENNQEIREFNLRLDEMENKYNAKYDELCELLQKLTEIVEELRKNG